MFTWTLSLSQMHYILYIAYWCFLWCSLFALMEWRVIYIEGCGEWWISD